MVNILTISCKYIVNTEWNYSMETLLQLSDIISLITSFTKF
jgi:hypothetical protein